MAGDDKDKKGGDDGSKRPGGPGTRREQGTKVLERTQLPRKFKVVFHNDDFTPMEFVVQILQGIFHKSKAEASRVMLRVHTEGSGIAGVYTREIAETKSTQTVKFARKEGFPLHVTAEPE